MKEYKFYGWIPKTSLDEGIRRMVEFSCKVLSKA